MSRNTGTFDRDELLGRGGDDTLTGGDKKDRLRGGSEDDLIFGNRGNDYIRGGKGSDTMVGGAGDDTFHWKRNQTDMDDVNEPIDYLVGFGRGDRIDLSALDVQDIDFFEAQRGPDGGGNGTFIRVEVAEGDFWIGVVGKHADEWSANDFIL
jgi:Ca2+-binding RTX toxin-like protein